MERHMPNQESTPDCGSATTSSFAEFAGIEHILLGDLRQLLSEPLTEQSRVWIRKLLDMLLDLLPGQFAAEEADGYLQDVLDEHPQWRRRVDSLRQQHDDLYQSLSGLRADLIDEQSVRQRASQVRRELRAWMDRFQSHQEAEMGLLVNEETHPALAG
jgi:hypothetical protein